MPREHHIRRITKRARKILFFAFGLSLATGLAPGTMAQENDPWRTLKAMSDYIAQQTSISVAFDSSTEVITPALQKIQFASSGSVLLQKPDKLRAQRTGGYADTMFIFDGKTFSVLEMDRNMYAQADFTGSVEQLMDKIRSQSGIEAPGADLLLANPYEMMRASASSARQIGRGVISGVECDHLAFRGDEIDWQIWIEPGPRPAPRRFVITSKTVTGGPEYTLTIKDWKTNEQPASDAFAFHAPAGARKVAINQLNDADEVPPGSIEGDKP